MDKYQSIDTQPTLNISPAYFILSLFWFVSLVILSLPVGETLETGLKIALFTFPAVMTVLVVLTRPEQGYTFWALGLTLLLTQTGFQLNIGQITSSGYEMIALLLLIILAFLNRRLRIWPELSKKLPGYGFLVAFILFAMIVLLVQFFRNDLPLFAIIQLKGFILYPMVAYLFIAGIQDFRVLKLVTFLLVVWYIFIAWRSLFEYRGGIQTSTELDVFRTTAGYAPTNLLGITLAVSLLVLLAITLSVKNQGVKITGLFFTFVLFAAILTTASRSALTGLVVGLVIIVTARKKINLPLLFILGAGILIMVLFPELTINRIFQLSDSSTLRREFYLTSGVEAVQRFWLLGAGWGKGYWYEPNLGLYPSGYIPWYHNDYLNMAVQIGVFGLVIYLLFWLQSSLKGFNWLKSNFDSPLYPYVLGFFAALACLLVSALFEHVMWRSDIAGLTGWTLGMMLAAINLHRNQAAPD